MKKMNEKMTTRIEEDTHTYASRDSNTGTHVRLDCGTTTRTPRWVKVFGIIAIVLVLLFVILHLTGNSFGGHGGHMSDGPDNYTSPIEHGVL